MSGEEGKLVRGVVREGMDGGEVVGYEEWVGRKLEGGRNMGIR